MHSLVILQLGSRLVHAPLNSINFIILYQWAFIHLELHEAVGASLGAGGIARIDLSVWLWDSESATHVEASKETSPSIIV